MRVMKGGVAPVGTFTWMACSSLGQPWSSHSCVVVTVTVSSNRRVAREPPCLADDIETLSHRERQGGASDAERVESDVDEVVRPTDVLPF